MLSSLVLGKSTDTNTGLMESRIVRAVFSNYLYFINKMQVQKNI
jgi:hypothetical protein